VAPDLVNVDGDGAVRTLTLNSPHNRNALSSQLIDELADGFRNATSDGAVRVILLTATGTVFCSGADLSERAAFRSSRMEKLLNLITAADVPVIARVNGHARAGGLGLLAASDLAVAVAASTFAFTEVRVGVAPALILVPSLMVAGRRFLARTTLTGVPFSAAEAVEAGLLTAVVEDETALTAWVDDAVDSILKSAPGAVAATKALLRTLPEATFTAGLAAAAARSAELFAGAEAAEGMDAFFAKRRPSWDASAE
jgi:enoyl-CoA hydratase/carnithine racemase